MTTFGWRILIAGVVSIFLIAGFYLGALAPLLKSHSYIVAYGDLQNIRSLEEFNNLFDPVFSFYSPIGYDEILGGYIDIAISAISQNQAPPPELARVLVQKVADKAAPALEKGAGFNYGQNLFKLGILYRTAALRYGNREYYDMAISIFERARAMSPIRPPFLYNLFELYVGKQDYARAKDIGTIILRYWPDDEEIRRAMQQLP